MSGPDDIEKPATESTAPDAPRKGRYGPGGRSGRTPPMIDGEAVVAPAQSGSVVDEAVLEEAAAAAPDMTHATTIAETEAATLSSDPLNDAPADPMITDEAVIPPPAPRRGWMVAAGIAVIAAAGGAYAYSEGWVDQAIAPYIGATPTAPVNPTARLGAAPPNAPASNALSSATSAPSAAQSSAAARVDRSGRA